ncbi:hypothetical protein PAHAL_2G453600 [Panicum hallii]|jgi:hypothetical protein|uniref:Bifunctional inhibitor/plant lipid transfer protein/seed storage helical domain-containing protein n=1 Tax=Panicum hallii TaxID=206008 RepID=A0A2S3H4G8_9POAL|nr:non-specific lipid transfer protein-like 1 [Panicum hallii]PAN14935.1 hypothetical protein PAHAL_2G453600 [Panicum hallii]
MARLGLGMPCLLAAAAVAVLALASGAASQGPAPAPASSVDCSSAVTGLIGCLSYVQQRSTQARPAKQCCAGVKDALKSPATVTCLCAALGQNNGATINFTRAATLPAACGENPAALSKCNIKMPGAPTEGPAPSSGSAPAANSPGTSKSAAARSPVSAFAIGAAVAAPLLSYYFL